MSDPAAKPEPRPKRSLLGIVKRTAVAFVEDDCPTMAAALSYAAVFSLPPLLAVMLMIVRAVWSPHDAQELVQTQIGALLGTEGIDQIQSVMAEAEDPRSGGVFAAVAGGLGLLLGATAAFVQLQASLNRAWEVSPDPARGGLKGFVTKRMLSFGMVLAIAFLLLVSLAMSTLLSAFGSVMANMLPGDVSKTLLHGVNFLVSFGVITLLFAAIFKVMPDAVIAWRDVWVGAVATALLFVLGKGVLGVYLGQAHPGEPFGAAGSLAVLLVWTYYASLILLLGAEFTQAWADADGRGITPKPGALHVERHTTIQPGPVDSHARDASA